MVIEVVLAYKREGSTMLSTGTIDVTCNGTDPLQVPAAPFTALEYRPMMRALAVALGQLPPNEEVKVVIQRTDRPGLLPYVLDKATVNLLRTDPVAGLQALSVESPSPAQVLANIKKSQQPATSLVTLRAGVDTLADAFGENVAFKVRGNELECPGCGFWGVYTTSGLLDDPDRVGQVFKSVFICQKRCKQRFVVSCHKKWGFVEVALLLATDLDSFFLPRGWNAHRPWVSRDDLQQKYNEYKKEKDTT